MIKIGVQTGGIQTDYSIDETYKIIHETGFEAADANFDELFMPEDIRSKNIAPAFEGSEKDYLEKVKPWRDGAKKYHVTNYQAHAPFPSILYQEDEYNDYLIGILKKSIICCDYIDCRNLIIHPFHYPHEVRLPMEEELEFNIECYSKLIPEAKNYGVTICLENMFSRHNGKTFCGCCGDPIDACRYVDELNRVAGTECFGFCLDTGHAILGGQEILRTMRILGKRIRAFHVHDNNGINDQHIAPYLGVLDWNRFIQGLADIRFDQTMCFETFKSWENVDPSLRKTILLYIYRAGQMFVEKAEALKQQ